MSNRSVQLPMDDKAESDAYPPPTPDMKVLASGQETAARCIDTTCHSPRHKQCSQSPPILSPRQTLPAESNRVEELATDTIQENVSDASHPGFGNDTATVVGNSALSLYWFFDNIIRVPPHTSLSETKWISDLSVRCRVSWILSSD